MTVTLEIDSNLIEAAQAQASAAGKTLSAYAESALRERLASQARSQRIDTALKNLQQAGQGFGREGRSWHEISHEGHRY